MRWLKKYINGGLLNNSNDVNYTRWQSSGLETGQWLREEPDQEITEQSLLQSNNIEEPQQQEESAEDNQTDYSNASQVTPINYEKIYSIDSNSTSNQDSGFSGSGRQRSVIDIKAAPVDTTGKAVYDGLINRGLNSLVASAITGNIAGESNFRLNANNPTSNAQGLVQWLGKRKKDFNNFAKATGRAANDLDVQLDFIVKELSSTHKYVADALSKAKTPQEATKIVLDKYEAPSLKDRKQSYPKRLSHTLTYYKAQDGITIDSSAWLKKYL